MLTPSIGHNSASLASAAEANVETGIWLLAKEFLVTAIQDRRLDRGHLRVLACFAQLMNRTSGKAWPDRVTVAAMAGMTPKAVSTAVSELKRLGYLIADREEVEAAGGRSLMVYTFGNIDHDTIRREITAFVESLKAGRSPEKTPYRGNSETPHEGNNPALGEQKTPHTGKDPEEGELSKTPYRGNSNSIEDNNKITTLGARGGGVGEEKTPRASRLPEDWKLPRTWGLWALDHFVITPEQVRTEAASFRDYWTGLGNTKNATKKDWPGTWRNWIRNSKKRYRVRKPETEAAPDLRSSQQTGSIDHEEIDYDALRREAGIVVQRGRDG